MVKRWSENPVNGGPEVVLASDYDALAARLAEAERVIALKWKLPKPCGHEFDCICADDAARAFLRDTVSAPEPDKNVDAFLDGLEGIVRRTADSAGPSGEPVQ
jgi:hypothetical protein